MRRLLLLCALSVGVANASTANLWYNLHTGKSRSFASAAAACRYIGTVPGRELGKNRGKCWKDGENGFPGFEMSEYWAEPKTCDLKHIEGKGSNGSHPLAFPKADKAPTMMRQCNNNCEVEYTRVKKEGTAAGSDYGGEACIELPNGTKIGCTADYMALQTGTVCNPKPGESNETTKYDEVNDDAAGDDSGKNNGGNDGSGNSNGGNDNNPDNPKQPPKPGTGHDGGANGGTNGGDAGGNQSGGQGGTGKDSKGDSGAADDPNKIDDKKPKPGGGGGGGGGGSPGQPGHDGKGGKDSGSADDHGQPGGNPGGGTGGNGGNPGGGGNGGNPGGNTNPGGGTGGNGSSADGDGKHDGKDDKGDGSSISGGDCKSGRAPICKGDPVQCYIAREQWRTACLAERGGGEVKGGSCRDNRPPECKGDATQCYIVKQQFYQGCEAARAQSDRDSEQNYVNGHGKTVDEVNGSSMGDAERGLNGNGKNIDLGGVLDLGGYGWSRTCPALQAVDMGKWGKFEMDGNSICTLAQILGNILVAFSLLFSVRYVFS